MFFDVAAALEQLRGLTTAAESVSAQLTRIADTFDRSDARIEDMRLPYLSGEVLALEIEREAVRQIDESIAFGMNIAAAIVREADRVRKGGDSHAGKAQL